MYTKKREGEVVDRSLYIPPWAKWTWAGLMIALFVIRIIWPNLNVDTISIVLFLLAALPWVMSRIDTATLPGGIVIKMQMHKLEQALSIQEAVVVGQGQQLAAQQTIINQLVIYGMSDYIFWHLNQIYHGKREGFSYLYCKNAGFDSDLKYLMDNGYIKNIDLDKLPDQTNLAAAAELTPVGEYMVEQREALRYKQHLENQNNGLSSNASAKEKEVA